MQTSRQLAAIMFTDIVGYTALMGENQEHAFKLLRKNRQIQKPLVAKFKGRWLKEMGDGALISFHSALDAVKCAIQIQAKLKEEPELQVRIGIHIGDVIFEGNDVFGDGVNISSRLQEQGTAGEILVSDAVYTNIKNIEGIEVEFSSEQHLKNVKDPIKVYKVRRSEKTGYDFLSITGYSKIKKPILRIAGPVVAGLALISVSYFLVYPKIISSHFDLSDKSVVVLPFQNLGENTADNYISMGITEDILVQLLKIDDIKVVHLSRSEMHRNSTGSEVEIGDELGAAFVLVGSVRKHNNRIRVNAKLIETKSGGVKWSESYDKPLEDLITVQSEIAGFISQALKIKLTPEQRIKINQRPTFSTTAYDLYLKGKQFYYRYNEKDIINAIELFYDALELDPEFSLARAGLSDSYSQLAQMSNIKELWLDSAFFHASIVRDQSPDISGGHKSLGLYYSIIGDTDKAIEAFMRAYEIDRNLEAVINLSRLYYRTGKVDKSIEILMDVQEYHPLEEALWFNFAAAYYRLNDLQKANLYLDRALLINPTHINSLLLKWIVSILSEDEIMAEELALQLGFAGSDNTDKVLIILQNEILQSSNLDTETSAVVLNQLMNGRETDYIDLPYIYVLIGYIYYGSTLQDRATKLFDYKIAYNKERIARGDKGYKAYYEIAQMQAVLGNNSEALDYLGKAFKMGWLEASFTAVDPAFRTIQKDQKFENLQEAARSRADSLRTLVFRFENAHVISLNQY